MNDRAIDDPEMRKRYAAQLARGHDPLRAATEAGFSQPVAMQFFNHGIASAPDVIEEVERLQSTLGPKGLLPTREETARAIYQTADKAITTDDKLKGLKLYAEVMGFIDKGTTNINTGVIANTKVVVVPASSSNSIDWQTRAIEQQRALAANVG